MFRRVLLCVVILAGLVVGGAKAWVSICDNGDPCYTTCTVYGDNGIVIRRYVINRCP